MRRCPTCQKDISHKHSNAVFCSNKGRGNCKDKYHNIYNPRGMALNDEWNGDDDSHPFSSEALGQWDD